ncbi:MAG TPA: type II CAAX endopeptidase family protein [Pyrinomonadaceae bacterium]|nr:type II CAAX endopeptidase family protein [Pyrinomonadaceae bacterium]
METPPPETHARSPVIALVFNRAGRLRGGWRFLVFVCAFVLVSAGGFKIYSTVVRFAPELRELTRGRAGFVTPSLISLLAATLVGWASLRALEDLPTRALGWAFHPRWPRDLLIGALVGGASLCAALLPGVLAGGTRFFPSGEPAAAIADTLAVSALIFLLGAAGEEALFRGYPLQTLLRSWPAWLALVPTAVLFAAVHLDNPNVVRGFTFLNTVLAGVWLAVAYLRTRSLWFPLGVHFGWNWTMGALLGVPVSGITQLTPAPVLRAVDTGPAWLTGGHYGVEGGVACTLALLLSTLFIWRTRLVAADPELARLVTRENPSAGADVAAGEAGNKD